MQTPSLHPASRCLGNLLPRIDWDVMSSSIDFASSTSVIQCIVIRGFAVFAHTPVLKLTFQLWNSMESGNYPRCISEMGGCQSLWIFEESLRLPFSSRLSFINTSWSTRKIPCAMQQSWIATRHSSGTRNGQRFAGNVGRTRAARCFEIVTVPRIRQRIRSILSWIWVKSWLTVSRSLSCCRDHSSNLACRAPSLSSQQRLLNSSISWQSCVRLSWKSSFLISNSPHKFILSLCALSALLFAWWSCNLRDSSSRSDSLRAISICILSTQINPVSLSIVSPLVCLMKLWSLRLKFSMSLI